MRAKGAAMALADLLSLARDYRAGTHGTHATVGVGSRANGQKTAVACGFPRDGTHGTHGNHENGDAQRFSHFDAPDIAAEPLMPEPGTPARTQLDKAQAKMVAGLLRGFHAGKGHRRHDSVCKQ